MQAYEFIEGYEQVVARFGVWPSFHDGEVLRIILDRVPRLPDGASVPSVEIHLRGWVMGPEFSEDGSYKLHNDSVVHLLFEDIFELELEGFNHQNVVSSLNLSLYDEPHGGRDTLHIELEHCYQFCCEFKALRAKVIAVTPYVEPSAR